MGGAKGCGPWKETRELARGRGLFLPAMVKVEAPSDMKEQRAAEVRGRRPLKNFVDNTLQISGKLLFGYKDTPFSR